MHKFFDALFEGLPGLICFSQKTTKGYKSRFLYLSELDGMRYTGKDLYFGLATRKQNLGQFKRGGKEECAAVQVCWLDVDYGKLGHASENLPPDKETALRLVDALPLKPSIIVDSGGGLHVYFLLKEPVALSQHLEEFERVNKLFTNTFCQIVKDAGWDADSGTANADRILRIPGSLNGKSDPPRPVELISFVPTNRYTLEEIAESCPDTASDYIQSSVSSVDVESIKKALQRIRKPNIKDKALALAKGESYSERGHRHEDTQKLVSIILFQSPKAPTDVILEVFKPVLELWASEENPQATLKNLLDKTRKHIDDTRPFVVKKLSEEQAVLKGYADIQGCSVDEFIRRLIIVYGNSYWVHRDGKYKGPYGYQTLDIFWMKWLDSFPIPKTTTDEKGKVRSKTTKEILLSHGRVAEVALASLVEQVSHFDGHTFYEAVCPRRKIQPIYHPQVDTWLRLMAGDKYERLLDWLSTVGKLDRQTSALYLSGSPGTGKTLLAHGLARLWGKAPTDLKNVAGNFNEALTDNPIVLGDEEIPKELTSAALRSILGQTTRTLSRKFLRTISCEGALRLILTSNNELTLIQGNEDPSENDLSAAAARIFHIVASDDARTYLENKVQDPNDWIVKDIIAQHVTWLESNHGVAVGKRFLVSGDLDTTKQFLAQQTKWGALVLEWIGRYLSSNLGKIDTTLEKAKVVLAGNGCLYVNSVGIVDYWDRFIQSSRAPSVTLIGRTLRSIQVEDKQHRFYQRRYRAIRWQWLVDWCKEQGLDAEKIETLIKAQVVFDTTENENAVC